MEGEGKQESGRAGKKLEEKEIKKDKGGGKQEAIKMKPLSQSGPGGQERAGGRIR